MGSSKYYKLMRVSAILGVLTVIASLLLFPVFPPDTAVKPTPYGQPIYAFEMARTVSDLQDVFGVPSDPQRGERIASMNKGNQWDFVFLILYGSFIFLFFKAAAHERPERVWSVFANIALIAMVADASENLILLQLAKNLEDASGLALLPFATGLKFMALGVCGIGTGLYLIKQQAIGWRCSGLFCLLAAFMSLGAYHLDGANVWFRLVGDGVGVCWIIQLVFAVTAWIRAQRNRLEASNS